MVLKPSEISQNTGKVLVEVLPRYLDQVGRGRQDPRAGWDPSPDLTSASYGWCGHGQVATHPALVSLLVKQMGGDHSCA